MRPDDARRRMVEQLGRYGIRDERVLAAMAEVPRERFVPPDLAARAYDDRALPIAADQTISQPLVVAHMASAVHPGPDDRVLEIGGGSGYGAAVLSRLAARVVTVERIPELAEAAAAVLADLGYDDVQVVVGDGSTGWPDGAPYDAVVVTAAGPDVPPSLLAQLAPGGRLVMPVGAQGRGQDLVLVEATAGGEVTRRSLGPVAFVPLIGEEGFNPG